MVKSRDFISLLCVIAFSVPLIIYFFGGGLIVHAEELPTPTPIPVPSGYSSLGDFIDNFNYNYYSYEKCFPNNDAPEGYNIPLLHEQGYEFFTNDYVDGDLSNGEFLIDNSSLGSRKKRYYNGSSWTVETLPETYVDWGSYCISYNTSNNNSRFTLTCGDVFTEIDSSKYSTTIDSIAIPIGNIGVYVSDELSNTYNYPYLVFNSSLLSGYNNVYVFSNSYDTYSYPNTSKFGDKSTPERLARDGSVDKLINSSIPVYITSFSERNINGNNTQDMEVLYNDVYFSEVYGIPHTLLSIPDPPSGEYPDGSGGDVTNNMYLETADWKFNIPKYWGNVTSTLVQPKYTANWGSGTVTFYGICNDFIQDNADDYKLVFNFYVKCNGHRFSDTHSEIDENFAKSFSWRSVEYDLADYVNNKSINVDFSVSDIFSNSWDQGMSTNVTNYLETIKTYNSIDNWDWSLSCDAHIVSGSYTSGSIQENYNFISQVSKEASNTITQNNNPYYPEDENGKPIIPDSDGTTSVTDKNGQIILTNYDNDNNNQSVVINGNDKSVIDGLIDKLVPNAQGNGGLTERFVNLTNANGWFAVMSSALPLMGSDFWSTLQLMFVTSLGILGCAFVIWIIVHII